jgi:hypothetical protein
VIRRFGERVEIFNERGAGLRRRSAQPSRAGLAGRAWPGAAGHRRPRAFHSRAGQVLISGAVAAETAATLAPRGQHVLRGISAPCAVFTLPDA